LTIREAIQEASLALADLTDGTPGLESELLLMQATGWPRTHLRAWPEQVLSPPTLANFRALVARRQSGEPIAYIRGRQPFWSLELSVTPDTLIPRPETELLVEIALAQPDGDKPRLVADLGAGSGAIAAALATERPHWSIVAIERSAEALAVARVNFQVLGVSNCLPVQGSWLRALGTGSLDLILANPPYVAAGDPHLSRGDLRFEPRAALASGQSGLDAITAIADEARRCLRAGGLIAVEHGFDQGPAVRRLFADAGLQDPETRRDLTGQERVTLAWAA
jgi:release factor glutamine methyltransferase